MSTTHDKNSPQIKTYGLSIRITDLEYQRIADFIQNRTGIRLPETKRVLVEGRIQKTLRNLGYDSFTPFIEKAIGKHADEAFTTLLIDLITTNKTDFYRESDHFTFLENYLQKQAFQRTPNHVLKVWSAACSTGEEAYTLAIILNELKLKGIISDFEIYATDISTEVLQKGITAEYHESRVQTIPIDLRRKYLLRHKDRSSGKVRIVKTLRDKVKFSQFNLMHSTWTDGKLFDVIFCRNVFIYFDRDTQFNVTKRLLMHLKRDGFLFLGHSETLNGLNLPVVNVSNTVYQYRNLQPKSNI